MQNTEKVIMHKYKKWRIGISIAFFVMFFWAFIGVMAQNEYFTHTVSALQFFPSFLEFAVTFLAGGGSGFILILILTLILGRVYCSFLCPLGTLLDVFIWLKVKGSGFKFKYDKPIHELHYGVTAAVLLLLALGSSVLLGVLDPFANFGRIVVNLLRPVYFYLNNALAYVLNTFDIYLTKPKQMHGISLSLLIYSLGFLTILVIMALQKGRLYCNTLCPVGGILSLASRKSKYKIKINPDKCTDCGLCGNNCKANCIDLENKELDFSRCVACYNCLNVCKFGAVDYVMGKPVESFDKGRRDAIKTLGIAAAGTALLMLPEKLNASIDSDLTPKKRWVTVIPPGAGNLKKYNSKCIRCHLCVAECPSKVLTPQFLEDGVKGFLQPRLDFDRSYCNYKCNVCTQVCPTGAILALSVAQKKITKIGGARFVKEKCIVVTKKKECLVCNEYCPTKACSLVPYEKGLRIPKVIEKLCIGCGACENKCPARPKKAIYVEGLLVHKKADKPSDKQKKWKGGKEFPF